MGFEFARSRVLNDKAFQAALGPDGRYVHIDCSVEEIPTDTPVGRSIWRLFNESPTSRLAFGIWWLTDAAGSTIYAMRPCGCHRYGRLEAGAELLALAKLVKLEPDFNLDLTRLQEGMVRFRRHAALRRAVEDGHDPSELLGFEATLPDVQAWSWPCKETDQKARASTLTLGLVFAAGGSDAGLVSTMDPHTSPDPALRDMWADALADAALSDAPFHPAANAHLGLTYVLTAKDEIAPAVAKACRELGCTPEELPLNALPVPLAARERAAALALGARGVAVPSGVSALSMLRRSLA